MKEWDGNPRDMWVWDDDEGLRRKAFVLYMLKGPDIRYPVVAVNDSNEVEVYKNCADMTTKKRMTNRELARWLTEKPGRERRGPTSNVIRQHHEYFESEQDCEVNEYVEVREDGGPWHEPLKEEQ